MAEQTIIQGDCLEVMRGFADKQFDLVLTDPPYGVTGLEWDNDKTEWMDEALRIAKDNAPIIVFGSQPFTTKIIHAYMDYFKYCWIWDKKLAGNAMLSNHQPLKIHEDIVIFCKGTARYFPILIKGKWRRKLTDTTWKSTFGTSKSKQTEGDEFKPKSILTYHMVRKGRVHPTQKPVELLQYLVQTYSLEGDTILDPFMGSGTTLVAAKYLNRNATGIEISPKYCEVARNRLAQQQLF